MLLAGDIGGTKTRLAIYDLAVDQQEPIVQKTFQSRAYASLSNMIEAFLSETSHTISSACLGVAGPVINQVASLTNLPWQIDRDDLQKQLDIDDVKILNDLEAAAYAIQSLEDNEKICLREGRRHNAGPIALVSPGTGLGVAFLVHDKKQYHAFPSEGGHSDFSPHDEIEFKLLQHLLNDTNHVSYETVCSGVGLPNIFRFLYRVELISSTQHELITQIMTVTDPNPFIVTGARSGCRLCLKTVEIFCQILAAFCSNVALTITASGGLYLGGGIPVAILDFLQTGDFVERFNRKGRLEHLVKDIPLYVIKHNHLALKGSARYAADHFL